MPGKILLVDDSQTVLISTAQVLKGSGYEVITLASPLQVTKTISEEHPDLVLIDVQMPTLRGDKIVEIASRHKKVHNCPMVLFSSMPEAELAALAKSSGASGYIKKTDDPVKLTNEVRRFLA